MRVCLDDATEGRPGLGVLTPQVVAQRGVEHTLRRLVAPQDEPVQQFNPDFG